MGDGPQTLILTIDRASDGTLSVRRAGPGADNTKKQAALLRKDDTLTVELGDGWPSNVGLKRVDFYSGATDKNTGNASTNYWERPSSWGGQVGTWFTGTATPGGPTDPRILAVSLKDKELPAQSDSHWYKITFDNDEVLDPEVINKSGSDPRPGGNWIDIATQ